MAEWLRRWTRNPLGSARVSSNLTGVDCAFFAPGPLVFKVISLNHEVIRVDTWATRIDTVRDSNKVPPGFEPGSPDSESGMLTVTPRNR